MQALAGAGVTQHVSEVWGSASEHWCAACWLLLLGSLPSTLMLHCRLAASTPSHSTVLRPWPPAVPSRSAARLCLHLGGIMHRWLMSCLCRPNPEWTVCVDVIYRLPEPAWYTRMQALRRQPLQPRPSSETSSCS